MSTPTDLTRHTPHPPAPRPSSAADGPRTPPHPQPRRRAPAAVVVAGSLALGALAALALAAAPFVPVGESELTGAVLLGLAVGWAALAVLSARTTDQPQRWAAVPALVLGTGGIALMAFGSSAHPVVDWVWPPVVLGLAVWMAVRTRRGLRSRAARWLLYPAIAAMGLAGAGGGYQTVGAAVDAATLAMPGRLVDVGGHRLHLSCSGSGGPTVVIEPGAGEMAANLAWITPTVSRSTRVCVYDRAGRGWSDPAQTPQDAVAISTDLHTLLHRAGEPGPYVVAGHSFGGLYVLTFAARYPDEVAGMVLLDSTSPAYGSGSRAASPATASHDALDRVSALASSLSRAGLGRLYAALAAGDFPAPGRDELRASTATAATLRSTIDEYVQGNTSMGEAASLRDLAGKPLAVLTAGTGSAVDWAAKQDRLAALSTDSVHRVVEGATHEALVGDRTYAATSSRAIVEVVSAVRTGSPLSR